MHFPKIQYEIVIYIFSRLERTNEICSEAEPPRALLVAAVGATADTTTQSAS